MPKVFRVFAALLLAAFLCIPNAGCTKDEVALNAYKTLETSAETYKAVMNAAQDLHRMGKMTDEQWNQVKDYAVVYFDSYQTAVAACNAVPMLVEMLRIAVSLIEAQNAQRARKGERIPEGDVMQLLFTLTEPKE